MAKAKKKRLFKIASEINIGKDAIVSYLKEKGFDIENKPTAMLTEDMISVVYEKFNREMRAIEVQREKLEKVKSTRTTAYPGEEDYEENIKSETPQSQVPQAAPANTAETAKSEQQTKESETKAENKKVKAGSPETANIGEVIDLSSIKEDTVPRRRKSKKKTDTEKETKETGGTKKAKPRTAKPKTDSEKAEAKPKPRRSKAPAAKKPVVEKAETPKPETPAKPDTEKVIEKAETAPKPETPAKPKPGSKPKTVKKEEPAKKKTETVEDTPETGEQLKGLTVLGKIDISSNNNDDDSVGSRKKRKRRKRKTEEDTESVISSGKKVKKPSKSRQDTPDSDVVKSEKKASKRRRKRKHEPINIESGTFEIGGASEEHSKRRRPKKKVKTKAVNQMDIEKSVRQTMQAMDSSSGSRQKMRSKRKAEREEKLQHEMEIQSQETTKLQLTEFVTTGDLASLMDVDINDVILKCMEIGMMVTINQRLDKDTITLIADDYGFEAEFVDEKQMQFVEEEEDNEEDLKPRSPIVTIMGHVDHGKTSLLDYIRKANVVSGEAGGITQHIGAYSVKTEDGRSITFLDTPGHEAFTAMRARGAQITDIVVLIVAADDSVMPQTIEAISHSKAADVPIVVAINKCDKPDANPDRIKQQLTDYDVLVEEWGGKNQSAEISAKQGINIDSLLEKILIEAEMLDLKANPNRRAKGSVVESDMRQGLGAVATVIVQKGELHVGDAFVSGTRHGRVRSLINDKGEKVDKAGPSTPVVVVGYDGLAEAGDGFMSLESESEARKIAGERSQLKREQELRQVRHITLDDISAQIQSGGIKDLNVVIKADVGGSAEALADALLKLSTDEVRVNVLHKGIGAITELDVMLAAASGGVVLGFNINPNASARRIAEREHVDIRRYDIIYDCINEVQMALEGLLTPDIKENVTAVVEVRDLFKISKVGTIAGCHVLSGTINRNSKIRLLRDGFKIYEGNIDTLKREKDDVKKVDKGYDCGIKIEGFNDIKVDDIIEAFEFEEIKRTLK